MADSFDLEVAVPATAGFALRAGHVTVEPKIDHCQV